MRKKWIGWYLALVLMTNVTHSEVRKLVRVDVSNQPQATIIDFMRLHPDIISRGQQGRSVDVLAPASQLEKITDLGIPLEVLVDDADEYAQTLKQQGYFDAFHSYEEMLAEMRTVEANHPEIAKLYDIGDSWEKTQGLADRDIWAIKISDNVNREEPQEPEVLYIGCHHAREIITPEVLLYFMDYLVDTYGTEPEVTYLVDNRQLWFVPMLNPDGHDFVVSSRRYTEDMYWRKNRRDNGDGTFGVDLNRNYGYMWGFDDIGSSPDPSSLLYRGTHPFSEPETQAIRDLVTAHHFVTSLSYHAAGGLWLYPWMYIQQNTPDHDTFVAIAESCVAYNGYEPGNPVSETIYTCSGNFIDWMYGEQTTKCKTYNFDPEVGYSMYPDTSRIVPYCRDNLGPNLYVAKVAEEYALPFISYNEYKVTEMHGNRDGIFDPGETVHLTFTLFNMGYVSTGLVGSMSTEDPAVDFMKRTAYFGNVDFREMASNEQDPFVFTIEADTKSHVSSFVLTITDDSGYTTSESLDVSIGPATVLVVDDDLGEEYEQYYTEGLSQNYPFDMWEIETQGIPSETLSHYEAVVWFTGDDRTTSLTPGEQTVLQEYLDSGGNLFLTGQNIGYDLVEEGSEGDALFYRTYLRADYVSDDSHENVLTGVPGDQISGDFTFLTVGAGGAGNQTSPSSIEPLSGATAVFTYYGSAHTAAVKYSGAFKVVYFAFGYEGVGAFGTGAARLRSSLMDNIVAWFRYEPHKGDVNEDGNVDILDVVEVVNIIIGLVEPTTAQFWAADVTQDGSIDILDVVNIVNVILGPTVSVR
ncbi:MAG: hypothetical protein JSV84_05645 [Gemmatimonadota bacterium]|nr:MAG: hypothetical protein JSV84_05645 [Gemmatimonadota bacterium]